MTSLEELKLESLKHVTSLPSLRRLTRLRRITLNTMKGLTDLGVLLTAPSLREVDLTCMSHLDPAQVIQLAAHPGLRELSCGLGSDWKNEAAAVPLPPVSTPSLHLALMAYRDPA